MTLNLACGSGAGENVGGGESPLDGPPPGSRSPDDNRVPAPGPTPPSTAADAGAAGVGRDAAAARADADASGGPVTPGTPAPADPSGLPLLDDFNRPDGPLTPWRPFGRNARVRAGSLQVGGGATLLTAFGVEQEAHMKLAALDPASSVGLRLKVQNPETGCTLDVTYREAQVRARICDKGATTDLEPFAATFAAGDVLGARLSGTALEVFKNGASLGSRPLPAWSLATKGGYIGVIGDGAARIDDFGGGDSGGGRFPSTPVRDAFERPDGPLSNWFNYVLAHRIADGRVHHAVSDPRLTFFEDLHTAALWTQEAGPDQEVQLTLTELQSSKGEMNLILKSAYGSYWHRIYVRYSYGARSLDVVIYDDKNVETKVGAAIPVDFAPGDRLRARATQDGVLTIFRNEKALATRDLTAWPYYKGGGYFGFVYRLSGQTTSLDEFRGR